MRQITLQEIRDYHFEKAEELRATSRRVAAFAGGVGLSYDERSDLARHARFVAELDRVIASNPR